MCGECFCCYYWDACVGLPGSHVSPYYTYVLVIPSGIAECWCLVFSLWSSTYWHCRTACILQIFLQRLWHGHAWLQKEVPPRQRLATSTATTSLFSCQQSRPHSRSFMPPGSWKPDHSADCVRMLRSFRQAANGVSSGWTYHLIHSSCQMFLLVTTSYEPMPRRGPVRAVAVADNHPRQQASSHRPRPSASLTLVSLCTQVILT